MHFQIIEAYCQTGRRLDESKVDAFYEIARKAYQNEFSGAKEGKLYRISSELYNEIGTDYSMVYISFDSAGKEFYYVDLLGAINEETFNESIRTLKFVRTPLSIAATVCISIMYPFPRNFEIFRQLGVIQY